jgi:hypothetical protein
MGKFQAFLLRVRLWSAKRRAKRAYLNYQAITSEYSCGASLTNFLSSRASAAAKEFDMAYACVRQLDPTAPEAPRLSL